MVLLLVHSSTFCPIVLLHSRGSTFCCMDFLLFGPWFYFVCPLSASLADEVERRDPQQNVSWLLAEGRCCLSCCCQVSLHRKKKKQVPGICSSVGRITSWQRNHVLTRWAHMQNISTCWHLFLWNLQVLLQHPVASAAARESERAHTKSGDSPANHECTGHSSLLSPVVRF